MLPSALAAKDPSGLEWPISPMTRMVPDAFSDNPPGPSMVLSNSRAPATIVTPDPPIVAGLCTSRKASGVCRPILPPNETLPELELTVRFAPPSIVLPNETFEPADTKAELPISETGPAMLTVPFWAVTWAAESIDSGPLMTTFEPANTKAELPIAVAPLIMTDPIEAATCVLASIDSDPLIVIEPLAKTPAAVFRTTAPFRLTLPLALEILSSASTVMLPPVTLTSPP